MKVVFAVFVAMLICSASSLAVEARGAICHSGSRITALKFYSSGNFHGAMDQAVSGGGCWTQDSNSARYHRGSINASRHYTYNGGCGQFCGNHLGNLCNGGAGNMITTTGTSGWDWRQMHINSLGGGHSKSKTCNRCSFGLVGSTGNSSGGHAHVENRRFGTKTTGWLSGKSVGQNANCTTKVGNATL